MPLGPGRLPEGTDDDYDDEVRDDASDESETVPCPTCGAPVFEEAQKCPHCGDWITAQAGGGRRQVRVMMIATVLIALLLLLVLCS